MKMQSRIDPLQSIPPWLLLLDCQFRGAFSLPPRPLCPLSPVPLSLSFPGNPSVPSPSLAQHLVLFPASLLRLLRAPRPRSPTLHFSSLRTKSRWLVPPPEIPLLSNLAPAFRRLSRPWRHTRGAHVSEPRGKNNSIIHTGMEHARTVNFTGSPFVVYFRGLRFFADCTHSAGDLGGPEPRYDGLWSTEKCLEWAAKGTSCLVAATRITSIRSPLWTFYLLVFHTNRFR